VKSLSELAALVGGQVEGDGTLQIQGVAGLEEARAGQLSFYGNTRYKKALLKTRASAVLVSADAQVAGAPSWVRVANPHLAFARISQHFHPTRSYGPGQSDRAFIHPEAKVHPSATVMALASVERGAEVSARAVLHPGVYVGENAQVGEDSVLHPNAVLGERCVVGRRCIVHAGAVIGADGFGFAFDPQAPAHVKIPQAGIARLEDDVELGACSCVDRATVGETVVGRGTKIDNLVQVAHNVTIGELCLLCAQVGVSGSAKLGQGVVLAGQVGVAGHLKIGSLVRVGAQAGVAQDIEDGQTQMGTPAFGLKDWMRASHVFRELPELAKELRSLRKRIDELERGGAKK
jgi:UDP-3-O-[3-hydroxymyristoyl] glucosamine N-acyltransferase